MSPTTNERRFRRNANVWTDIPSRKCGGDVALDEAIIADLSSKQISQMTDSELEQVVLASPLPRLRPGLGSHLGYQDRSTLERLAYLASFCCRNRDH